MSPHSLEVNHFQTNPQFCLLFSPDESLPVFWKACDGFRLQIFRFFFSFYFLALYVFNILLVEREISVVSLDSQCHDLDIKP